MNRLNSIMDTIKRIVFSIYIVFIMTIPLRPQIVNAINCNKAEKAKAVEELQTTNLENKTLVFLYEYTTEQIIKDISSFIEEDNPDVIVVRVQKEKDIEEIQTIIEEQNIKEKQKIEAEQTKRKEQKRKEKVNRGNYTIRDLEYHGVIKWNNKKFTYYSERVLPGKGLKILGRHTENGFVKDSMKYIVLAATKQQRGKIIETPFGQGKVYDVCAACAPNHYDIYTR